MVGGKFKFGYVSCRSRPYYFRRCKMSSSTNIESLPDELLFQIFLEIPARDIYKGARLVCKKWNKMIRNPKFVDAHLQHSTPGLIVDCRLHSAPAVFVAMRRGRIEKSEFNFEFREGAPSSCNGLIVHCDLENNHASFIANPATNQHFSLPQVSPQVGLDCYYVIAYAEVSKQYKVVLMHCSKFDHSRVFKCAILTVGVDKSWRHLHMKHVPVQAPLTTEGFIHWFYIKGTHVLTLNVETEIITETPVPQYDGRFKYYLSTRKSLSLLVRRGEYPKSEMGECSYDVWDMRSETGEWTKVTKIDLEAQKCKFDHLKPGFIPYRLRPVGWVNYPEVLAFYIAGSRVCVFYNVRSQEIYDFEVDYNSCFHKFGVHRNSLVWLDGC